MRNVRRFFTWWLRLSFNVPSIVIVLVVTVLLFRILDGPITAFFGVGQEPIESSTLAGQLILGVTSGLLATALVWLLGYFLMGWRSRVLHAGEYDAFEIDSNDNSEIPWGTASIRFMPFSAEGHHTKVKLRLVHNDIELDGQGLIINNSYLVGHYYESGEATRRRAGSFSYELEGNGNVWRGSFSFVSPDSHTVTRGTAKWVRRRESTA